MTEKTEPTPAQEAAQGRGPTTLDAAIQALERAGRPLTTQELIPEMKSLGWKSRGGEYYSVFGALARAAKQEGSRVVKAGPGIWGLRDWKPV